MDAEDSIKRQHEASDPSKARGLAAAAGAGAVFGPVGVLFGLGVYGLSRMLEKGEMRAAVEAYRMNLAADQEQATQIDASLGDDLDLAGRFLAQDGRADDYDRERFKLLGGRRERALSAIEHFDAARRAEGIKDLNAIDDELAGLMKDVRDRGQTVADDRQARDWALQDKLLDEEKTVRSELRSNAEDDRRKARDFGYSMELQNNAERRALATAAIKDGYGHARAALQVRSGAINDEDTLLAQITADGGTRIENGAAKLSPTARAAAEDFLALASSKDSTVAAASGLGAGIGGLIGGPGGAAIGGGALGGAAKAYELYKKAAAKLSDAELMATVQKVSGARRLQSENVVNNINPVLKKAAEDAGVDPALVTTHLFEMDPEQAKLRQDAYSRPWNAAPPSQFIKPGAAPGPAGEDDWGKTIMGGVSGYLKERPVN